VSVRRVELGTAAAAGACRASPDACRIHSRVPRIVGMGVSVVSLAIGGIIYSHQSETSFEDALREAIAHDNATGRKSTAPTKD
jgi:hypothetical protein